MATSRRLRLLLVGLLVIASPILAIHPTSLTSRVSAVGPPGDELIQVPLRWCAIKGSKAADDPAWFGEPDTDNVLWRRHERATDRIWTPGANITFRSAITALIRDSANFPIIDDPNPSGPGMLGDIRSASITTPPSTELRDAVHDCGVEWDELFKAYGSPLIGRIAVNARQIVSDTGAAVAYGETLVAGPIPTPTAAQRCTTSVAATLALDLPMVVEDFSTTGTPTEDARVVGHELGHTLNLRDGNGLDDDGDGNYDGFCDPGEDPPKTDPAWTASVMTQPPIPDANDLVTNPEQRTEGRAIAMVVPGAMADPPARLVPTDTISDRRMDSAHDADVESVDVTSVGLAIHVSREMLYLSHTLFGLIGPEETNRYLLFVDLDDDRTTGGSPERLGFESAFAGAELVTQVVVEPERTATATVWVYDDQAGDFVEVVDPSIQAAVYTALTAHDLVPVYDAVSVEVPLGLVGPIGERILVQAIAEQVAPGKGFDVLPGETPDRRSSDGVPMFMVPPEFPVCAATPEQVQPGDRVTIEATGFNRPGEAVHVVLGDQLIAEAPLDEEGNLATEVVIPQEAREGPRLITVGVDKTALTADCVLQVGDVQ